MDIRTNTVVIQKFISDIEQNQLRETATHYRQNGILEPNPGGPRRFRKKIFDTPYCDAQIRSIGDRIVTTLGLQDCPVDPYLGWIISFIEPGGFIKPHIDAHDHYQKTTDRHLRCNLLVQSDDESAYPIVDGVKIAIEEKSLWAFFASEHLHGTNIIRGGLPRIVYQFGFTVPGSYAIPSGTGISS